MDKVLKNIAGRLRDQCEGKVVLNQPLSQFTTYKIGGNASLYLRAECVDDIRLAVEACSNEKIPYYVIGKGSNVLVSDYGYDGLVIELGTEFRTLKVNGNHIICGGGISLSKVAAATQRYNLKGLSFMAGIPGSVGGAVAVNAGAYGHSICEKVCHAAVFSSKGMKSYEADEILKLSGYRKSFLPESEIILEVTFILEKGNHNEIETEIKKYLADRKRKHPLDKASAGSVFKNPKGVSAAKLIEAAGWKGKSIGGAQISPKHANFIVNNGNAKANDVFGLINLVRSDIYYRNNIKLVPEIKFLGFFEDEEKK